MQRLDRIADEVPHLPAKTLAAVLADPAFYYPLALSIIGYSLAYVAVVRYFEKHLRTDRQRAWILTLFSATTMSVGAFRFSWVFATMPKGSTIKQHPDLDSSVAIGFCAAFVGFLIADMIVGTLAYPEQFHPLTGWFHHLGYTAVVLGVVQQRVPGGFLAFAAMLELPTIPLSLGNINRQWKRDYTFGVLFFLTRIVFHSYVIVHCYHAFPATQLWMVTAIPFPLHLYWFRGWVNQMRRKAGSRNSSPTKEELESTGTASSIPLPTSDVLRSRIPRVDPSGPVVE
ncbi:hypothetical protein BJ742DRAFT_450856 [Cladochytrium replicatum]|nr:hypothetical protein BJ742DRAFT_450856 [Cladochytrium replicatum]